MALRTNSPTLFCPHCSMPIEAPPSGDPGKGAARCANCMLLVGAGRAVDVEERDAASRSAAVGWISSKARRDEGEEQASEPVIGAAIRRVAQVVDAPVERLRMTDYQRRAVEDSTLPALADVYSAFGTWKKARTAAAAEAQD